MDERNDELSSFDSVYRLFSFRDANSAFLFARKEFDRVSTSQSLVWFSRLRAMDAYEMNAITVIEWILFLDFFEAKAGYCLQA